MPPTLGSINPVAIAAGNLQSTAGLAQMIFSGRKKAQIELDALQSPEYEGSKPLSTYYQTALQRYYTPPTESAMYKRNQNNLLRNTATGLSALRESGMGLAGVNRLIANQNNASLNAEAAAEQQQNQRFGQLAGATNMMGNEDLRKYQYNKLMPFQRTDRLKQMKLAAANARFDAGMQNIYGGLGTAAMGSQAKK